MSHVFNLCPHCSVDLPEGSISCSCGWKKRGGRVERAPRAPMQCAHSGCSADATLRLRLPTGWGDVCRAHAEYHWQREADEFNRAHGLDTGDKQRVFFREKLDRIKRSIVTREPGQDDEERADA